MLPWTVHKNRVVIDAAELAARNKEFVRENKRTAAINLKICEKDTSDETKFLKEKKRNRWRKKKRLK